ncbi:hypothetical protein [Aquiflexum lacus]|uniref:hypothetical protein n=1 Tax=Aquiflexum lacus TaxID=2483805 RepID=UPI001894D8BB|nr:hypothetical protein [Aquiflexum lacus]
MENLQIESTTSQIILKLNKKGFTEQFLDSLIKRLKIEDLAQKSALDDKILKIADEINQDWWDKNGEEFLKNIAK